MRVFRLKMIGATSALALAAAIATPATAQTSVAPPTPAPAATSPQQDGQTEAASAGALGDQLGDIIVTAQKRSESVQRTPLAISAVTGDALRAAGVTNVLGLQNAVPNVNINVLQNIVRINIRGIGTGAVTPVAEASVAFHVDGVYVARPESQADAFFDIERVEVVRGPQGTLYGRNATGGAVNVITADPTSSLSGYAQLTLGNYGTVITEGAVSGPLANGISARLAFQTSNHDGYGVQGAGQPLDDANTKAVRGKLKFALGSNVSLLLAADYFHQNDASGISDYIRRGPNGLAPTAIAFGGNVTPDLRTMAVDYPNRTRKNDWSTTATLNWDLAPEISISSITGYRNTYYRIQADYDNSDYPGSQLRVGSTSHQVSEELRATGDIGRFSYTAGLYFLKTNLDFFLARTYNRVYLGGPNLPVQGLFQQASAETVAKAAFAQVTYRFTDTLAVDLGLRYNDEHQVKTNERIANDNVTPLNQAVAPNFTTNIPYARDSSKSTTPKVTVRFEPTRDLLFYATYAKGFKSGGFSLGAAAPAVAPERLEDFEGGIKTQWLDRRLQLNLAAFHYNYTDLQVRRLLSTGGSILESAGSARIKGIEASVVALPVPDLRLSLDLGLTDAKYLRYSTNDATRPALGVVDLAGKRLIETPRYRLTASVEYTFRPAFGNVTVRAEGNFVDTTYFTAFNEASFAQPAYDRFNLYVNYESPNRKWFGGLYMRNVENEDVLASAFSAALAFGGYVQGTLQPPRTFGARVGLRF